ncbi:MAG TPA: CAP domain-containing protein [Pyrinomonadaceae bacterium]|nr:CAP domain-containing protein [Pyrinomonadaceae bacterium]
MKRFVIANLFLLLFIFAAKAQTQNINCANKNGLNVTEINALLKSHNDIRTDQGLPNLKWNCSLADYAQEWATRGIAEHRDTFYGENIFAASDEKVSPLDGLQRWMNEQLFWNSTDKTCQEGKNCVHFLQVINKQTSEIGCGINRAATGKWKVLMVCNYNPAS